MDKAEAAQAAENGMCATPEVSKKDESIGRSQWAVVCSKGHKESEDVVFLFTDKEVARRLLSLFCMLRVFAFAVRVVTVACTQRTGGLHQNARGHESRP